MAHETKFKDDTEITSYLASAYAEGFCEGEGASEDDKLRAWSYLIGTKLAYSLQGWYGRMATSILESGIIDENGVINWDLVNDKI